MRNKIAGFADRIIYLGYAGLFFVTPLLVVWYTSELFEFNKMFFVYGMTIIILAAWLVKSLFTGDNDQGRFGEFWDFRLFRVKKTPLDLPILFFLLSQAASAFFSVDTNMSLWGYYSRQNGGLISTVSYIILFYAFVKNLHLGSKLKIQGSRQKKGNKLRAAGYGFQITKLLYFALASGVIVAAYGIAQHFGIDKDLWVQDVQNRVFSTMGQPNWLAAYLSILSFVSLGVGFSKFMNRNSKGNPAEIRKFKNWLFLVGIPLVFYLAIVYTKSKSGLFAFWVADALFWAGIFWIFAHLGGQALKKLTQLGGQALGVREIYGKIAGWLIGDFGRVFAVLHFGLLVLTLASGRWVFGFLGLKQESAGGKAQTPPRKEAVQEAGQALNITDSGEIRKYVWQGAINAWRANPLFGTGVETFSYAFYKYKPVQHNTTSEWDFLYNKAHNEYLNYLATTGIFGFLGYLGVIGGFFYWVCKNLQFTKRIIILGLFAGWISILATNFFGFSVVVTNLYFWLIPALVFSLGEDAGRGSLRIKAEKKRKNRFRLFRGLLLVVIIFLAGFSLFTLGKYWYADVLYARGKKLSELGYTAQARKVLLKAVNLRPGEPIFLDELGYITAQFAVSAKERGETKRARELILDSLEEQKKALLVSPYNLSFLRTRVRIYYLFWQEFSDKEAPSSKDSFLGLAIRTLEAARELAPNDPKIVYNLALLETARPESSGSSRAKALLREALRLKPNYIEARNFLEMLEDDKGKN